MAHYRILECYSAICIQQLPCFKRLYTKDARSW